MSSFTQPLVVEKIGPLEWRVAKAFRYYVGEVGSSEFVDVREGVTTDLASVPFVRRVFVGDQAAVVHDVLYRLGMFWTKPAYEPESIAREEADIIFYEAMLVLGVGRWKAAFYFRSVRLLAGRAWRRYRTAELEARREDDGVEDERPVIELPDEHDA